MKTIATICCLIVGACAVDGIRFGYTHPETGLEIGGTYSSKGGLVGSVTIESTK